MIETKALPKFATGRVDASAPGASVRLEHIVKRYADTAAVEGVSLDIAAGQFVTLLGASGSGKTTLLRIIAGFVEATSGRVVLDGEDISRVPVHHRHIGMVFQNYALFPHMSVAKNVAFPLEMRKVPRRARPALVQEALEAVHLGEFGRRLPRELSGGQQQRVALARAIVGKPRLLLMDEPLGALDRRLREAMQLEIRRLSHELGLTVVNVTHDQEEALTMSDRIALLAEGRLVQYGTPADLYTRPNSEIVAKFLGESNMFRGPVRVEDGLRVLDLPHGRVVVPPGASDDGPEVIVAVRPSAVRIGPAGPDAPAGGSFMPGEVTACVYAGDSHKIIVTAATGAELIVRCDSAAPPPCEVGDKVILTWQEAAGVAIPADR
ncbi:ABC transporter ATP-binding protein [Acrocarpospora macrocephala]|uniref:Spermidine/putrescine import ATP-binding protein PotA n=1 Tax=Acrocarpospora macrocephala TaxID=150177 RepID=A0A5M3WFY4_9ACTN|nr:ABC transporter ATP-binding protein [Acrocarpospora macrocephala]GES07180.1 polyamine-transporting ATPase [Acrocarpospora macrocephala]